MSFRRIWHLSMGWVVIVLLAACGGNNTTTTTALSPGAKLLQQAQHIALRDATFTIDFTADRAHDVGTGALTTKPIRFALIVKHTDSASAPVTVNVIGYGVENAIFLYSRLNNSGLWSMLNDGADGYFVNYDTEILNYDQLSAAKLIGPATIDNQTTWHIQATVTMQLYAQDGTLIPSTGGEEIWLRQSDAFPVEIHKSVAGSGTASDGTQTNLSLQATYRFTTWNTGATVKLLDPSQIAASG